MEQNCRLPRKWKFSFLTWFVTWHPYNPVADRLAGKKWIKIVLLMKTFFQKRKGRQIEDNIQPWFIYVKLCGSLQVFICGRSIACVLKSPFSSVNSIKRRVKKGRFHAEKLIKTVFICEYFPDLYFAKAMISCLLLLLFTPENCSTFKSNFWMTKYSKINCSHQWKHIQPKNTRMRLTTSEGKKYLNLRLYAQNTQLPSPPCVRLRLS